ncbi:hypothetical protein AB1L42_07370 [Thalassoglobus sp. JC818]|uniref:hypothetical protein n=1 Tax=Thalassoglobus sp. JC818 TaxID=3232136 RepID=UPI003458DB37
MKLLSSLSAQTDHAFVSSLRRIVTACLITSALIVMTVRVSEAQTTETEEEDYGPRLPFAMVTIRSLDQSLVNIGEMFEASGRPDMTEMIEEFLTDRAGNLDGIDRTRPVGVMFFLDDSLPPRPTPVAYIPIDDLDAFVKTAALGPLKPERVEGEEGRFKLGGGRRALNMVIQDDYAFATPNEYLLEDEMPHPLDHVSGFASRYDASVSLQLRNISPIIRNVFLATFQTSAQAELQQRDDETAAAHKIRKANGQSGLEFLTQLLRDGEQVTLGLQANPEEQTAALELLFDATPDSEFAKFMTNIGGRKSSFEGLYSELHPLTLSVSWMLDRREREAMSGLVDAMDIGFKENLPETVHPSVERLAQSLRATIEQEHLNGILQFVPLEDRKFVLLGALKLVGSNSFGEALREVLSEVESNDAIDTIELDAHEHQSVVLHRLQGSNSSGEDRRIYGGDPSVYLGTGNGVLWFGLGGDEVTYELDFAIDQFLASSAATIGGSTAPFQLVFRMLPWLDLPPQENADPLQRELTDEAMSDGGDAVRIEIRPTENGARARMQFENGFVRLLGLFLATKYDESQL